MHPFVKVLLFFLLLLVAGVVDVPCLIALLLVLSVLTLKLHSQSFVASLQRMRWLFLSIFLIYAFGTPGELLPQLPLSLAPTIEGLQLGFSQISRLVIALAALTMLLSTSTKEDLMLALHMVLKPLGYLGLDVKCFSVRLLLTLSYVDEFVSKRAGSFRMRHIGDIHRELEMMPTVDVVNFEEKSFNLVDKVLMVLMLLILIVMIAMRFV